MDNDQKREGTKIALTELVSGLIDLERSIRLQRTDYEKNLKKLRLEDMERISDKTHLLDAIS